MEAAHTLTTGPDGSQLFSGPESREVALSRALGGAFDHHAALNVEAALRGGSSAAVGALRAPPLPLFPAFLGTCVALEEYEMVWEEEDGEKKTVGGERVVRLLALERAGRDLYAEVCTRPALFAREPLRRCVVFQLLTLLAGLHERGVLHRDIKLQNVLLQWVPWEDSLRGAQLPPAALAALGDLPGYPLLRLCDLGASRAAPLAPEAYCAPPPPAAHGAWEVGRSQADPLLRAAAASSHVCARWYRAPELLCGSAFYGPPSDAWSMALAIAELYYLSAALTDERAARGVSAKRGDAACDSLPLDEVQGEAPAPALARRGAAAYTMSAAQAEAAWKKGGWTGPPPLPPFFGVPAPLRPEERVRATLFHGSCDATQLLSIVNVLGTPSDGAVADMRLPLECQIALRGVRDAVLAAASADACLKLHKIPPVDVVALLAERFAVPRDMADLLRTMLRWAPSERTTAVEALKHPALGGSGVGVPA